MGGWPTVVRALNGQRCELAQRGQKADAAAILVSQRLAEVLANEFALSTLLALREAYREMLVCVDDDRLQSRYGDIEKLVDAWECIHNPGKETPIPLGDGRDGQSSATLLAQAAHVASAYARFTSVVQRPGRSLAALPEFRRSVEECVNNCNSPDKLARAHAQFARELQVIEGRSPVGRAPAAVPQGTAVDYHALTTVLHPDVELIEAVCIEQLRHFRAGVLEAVPPASPEASRQHALRSIALIWAGSIVIALSLTTSAEAALFFGLIGPALQFWMSEGWGTRNRGLLRGIAYSILIVGVALTLRKPVQQMFLSNLQNPSSHSSFVADSISTSNSTLPLPSPPADPERSQK
jgi:hypothetical protein